MTKLKPIEQLAEDGRVGDLIRLETTGIYDKNPVGTYAGYIALRSNANMFLSDVPNSDTVQNALLGRARLNLYGNFQLKRFCTEDGSSWTCVAKKYEVLRRAKKATENNNL